MLEHPRKVRGGSVHQTIEDKRKDKRQIDIKEEIEEKGTEEIEKKFLAPQAENFVVTNEVDKYKKRALRWIEAGYPVHFIGPTGCGKSSLALHLASELGRSSVWISGDESIRTSDLIGGYSRMAVERVRDKFIHNVFKDKDVIEPTWVKNALTIACKNGYTLIYNEFSRSKPEANNILLSVLEENVLELPTKFGKDRYIKVHPDFNLILTSNNIEYAGVHRPQDALLDRVAAIYMDYYSMATELKIVQAHAPKLDQKVVKKIVKIVKELRKKMSEGERPGTRAPIMIAKALQVGDGYSEEDLEQVCIDVVASKTARPSELQKKKSLITEAIKAN